MDRRLLGILNIQNISFLQHTLVSHRSNFQIFLFRAKVEMTTPLMTRAAALAVAASSCMDCTVGEVAWKAVVHGIPAASWPETEEAYHKKFRGPHLRGSSVAADNSYMPMGAQARVGAAVGEALLPSCVGVGVLGTSLAYNLVPYHLPETNFRENCLDVENCVDLVAP